ncbi:hypothetical protein D3Z51_08900 [Clostridiaceae bacterium]|nr:hypothetical protein [Clostridiaceae bacterium]RKI14378.1 hypothetical protein D7V81_08385 [bacterium 1XD21-70]
MEKNLWRNRKIEGKFSIFPDFAVEAVLENVSYATKYHNCVDGQGEGRLQSIEIILRKHVGK